MSRKSEERRALLLLLLILVVGLGLMFLSRETRQSSGREVPRSASVGKSQQGCNAGELDIQEALNSGELPRAHDGVSLEGASAGADQESSEGATQDSSVAVGAGDSSPQDDPSSSALDSEEGTSGVRSSQLPVTLLISPGLSGVGFAGRVHVRGLSGVPGSEGGQEATFSWHSEVLEGPWPLRLDAQLPVGLDLQISFEPQGEGAPAPLTGAVRPNFDPTGTLELVYQLDRVR